MSHSKHGKRFYLTQKGDKFLSYFGILKNYKKAIALRASFSRLTVGLRPKNLDYQSLFELILINVNDYLRVHL